VDAWDNESPRALERKKRWLSLALLGGKGAKAGPGTGAAETAAGNTPADEAPTQSLMICDLMSKASDLNSDSSSPSSARYS